MTQIRQERNLLNPLNEHEQAAVKVFVIPSRQERFLDFLANPKNRQKFTRELAHRRARFLNPKSLRAIPPSQQNPESIASLLKRLGAGDTCWVLSEGPLDGEQVDLLYALNEVVGRGYGTIISCIAGNLAYFESEDERYILQK